MIKITLHFTHNSPRSKVDFSSGNNTSPGKDRITRRDGVDGFGFCQILPYSLFFIAIYNSMLNLMPDNVLELIASIYPECLRGLSPPSIHRSCLVSPIPKKVGDTALPLKDHS